MFKIKYYKVMSNTNINDQFCGKIVFDTKFDPKQDIYISYEVPNKSILTEDSVPLLTESGFLLVVENEFRSSTGLVTYITNTNPDLLNGEAGFGLGLLASNDTGFQSITGHIASIAIDLSGGYALSGLFKNSGTGGEGSNISNLITARVSSTNSEYDFLSSTKYDSLSSNLVDIEAFRFGFRNYLSKYSLDVKIDGIYTRVFEADYDLDIESIPSEVKIGISHSGHESIFIRDITYSGVNLN
jgi:hypothetical protein